MKNNYYNALAILGFMIGGGIPFFIALAVTVPEQLQSAYFGVMFMLGFPLFRRIGRKMHQLADWAVFTKSGIFSLTLAFSFFVSGTATLLSLLVMPKWAHITLFIVIGLIASVLLFTDIMKDTEIK